MKITQSHLDALRERIAPLDTEQNRTAYRNGEYPRAEITQDVNKRYRWDLYWAARGYEALGGSDTAGAVYTDAHIDTALRKIVPSL